MTLHEQCFFFSLFFLLRYHPEQSGSSSPREGPSWDIVDGMVKMCHQIQNGKFHEVHKFQTAGAKWPVQVQWKSQSLTCRFTELLQTASDRLVHDLLQDHNNEDPPPGDRRTMFNPHGLHRC